MYIFNQINFDNISIIFLNLKINKYFIFSKIIYFIEKKKKKQKNSIIIIYNIYIYKKKIYILK